MRKYAKYIKWGIILLLAVSVIVFVVTCFYPLLLLALVLLLGYFHFTNGPEND